jgi:hypothetical protein
LQVPDVAHDVGVVDGDGQIGLVVERRGRGRILRLRRWPGNACRRRRSGRLDLRRDQRSGGEHERGNPEFL